VLPLIVKTLGGEIVKENPPTVCQGAERTMSTMKKKRLGGGSTNRSGTTCLATKIDTGLWNEKDLGSKEAIMLQKDINREVVFSVKKLKMRRLRQTQWAEIGETSWEEKTGMRVLRAK